MKYGGFQTLKFESLAGHSRCRSSYSVGNEIIREMSAYLHCSYSLCYLRWNTRIDIINRKFKENLRNVPSEK